MTETVVTIEHGRNPAGQPKPAGPAPGQPIITFNIGYYKTLPGLLKLVQLILGIICMACASAPYASGGGFFVSVTVIAFISTLLWIFVYLLGIRETLNLPINWLLTELINTAILALLYLIGMIVKFATAYFAKGIAAAVFGLINTLAYTLGAYLLLKEFRETRQ